MEGKTSPRSAGFSHVFNKIQGDVCVFRVEGVLPDSGACKPQVDLFIVWVSWGGLGWSLTIKMAFTYQGGNNINLFFETQTRNRMDYSGNSWADFRWIGIRWADVRILMPVRASIKRNAQRSPLDWSQRLGGANQQEGKKGDSFVSSHRKLPRGRLIYPSCTLSQKSPPSQVESFMHT